MTYVRRHIFWSEPGKIRRANLDGSGVTAFVSDDELTVGGLALRRKFEDDRLAHNDSTTLGSCHGCTCTCSSLALPF